MALDKAVDTARPLTEMSIPSTNRCGSTHVAPFRSKRVVISRRTRGLCVGIYVGSRFAEMLAHRVYHEGCHFRTRIATAPDTFYEVR